MNKTNKKGFTLAELLIVVAIIAVLVAIAIPVFTSQLEKSKEATDLANIRAAYAEAMVKSLDNGGEGGDATSVPMVQKAGWEYVKDAKIDKYTTADTVGTGEVAMPSFQKGDVVKVSVAADGTVTIAKN
ncbi:MAG: prepilin-type N-terminal cleavage/methylation domain-containing protein [Erysipelotrichaceae bacterium]|nr:prepilin-type N-terminal cleavage/methylation domain-containing protein [Erysipelotrichaceae bacterium]